MLKKAVTFNFRASNNEAEYKALIIGLHLARICGATTLKVHSDFQLVVSYVKGEFEVKEPGMRAYTEIGLKFSRLQYGKNPKKEECHNRLVIQAGSINRAAQRRQHQSWPPRSPKYRISRRTYTLQ